MPSQAAVRIPTLAPQSKGSISPNSGKLVAFTLRAPALPRHGSKEVEPIPKGAGDKTGPSKAQISRKRFRSSVK